MVEVTDEEFIIRFGPWLLQTPLDNIVGFEPTGPFSFIKTAGPAHLSVADRGITCATNSESGLCIQFSEPVPCIDPWGRIRHPAVTVTVERAEDLQQLLDPDTSGGARDTIETEAQGVAAEAPWTFMRRLIVRPVHMARATWRSLSALPGVSRSYSVSAERAPWLDDHPEVEEVRPMNDGTGPVLERTYRAQFVGTTVTPEHLMELITEDLNEGTESGIADFVDQRVTDGSSGVGTEYSIRMPGPWDPSVRVIDRTPTSLRFATMSGHMEAGQIELLVRAQTSPDGERLIFEIRSVARAADHLFSVIYNRLRIAREMQLYMWVIFCRSVGELSGGRLDGKIELETVEYRS